VHYTVATPDLADRVALYLAADVMLATPLREGATVAALEYVAAARSDAALVLSEFSGTAAVLPHAYVVNPYDDDAVRMGVGRAIAAGHDERADRMRHMRSYTDAYDNHCWAERLVSAVRSSRPHQAAALDPVGSTSKRTLRSRRRFSVHSGDGP
jgi:trehalose 6-phosphate synthase